MSNRLLMRPRIIPTALFVLSACFNAAYADPIVYNGEVSPLGNGSVNTYLVLENGDAPVAIGIRMTEGALHGLPTEPNNTTRCFDSNGDGRLEAGTECLGEYETMASWPEEIKRTGLPFKWFELDWNAHGHAPANVYDTPHFDFHFYMVEREAVASIRSGTCGIMMDCRDFERARMPVPAARMPAGYVDVGAAVPAMGNHLVNTASPEFAPAPEPFSHTLIYGAYDGQITFIEPMVAREFLASRPNLCVPITQPEKWRTPGSYPTEYCIRYIPEESALTISLEGFVERR